MCMFVSDLTLKRKGRALRGVYISYVCSVRKIKDLYYLLVLRKITKDIDLFVHLEPRRF